MTPRTRSHGSSGGSHHTSTGSSHHTDTGGTTTTHRPDTESPDTSTRRPDQGGPGGRPGHVDISPDNLDSMASRLSTTGGKVDAVGTKLSGISVGPQSMGIVGGSFTGAAQQHVQTAQQHVTRTREAVTQAQTGTKGTADTYRQREADNAANLNSIDTTTAPPKPKGTTSGTTTPSSSTTPSGTTTPPSTTPPPPSTTPSGTGTPSTPPPGTPAVATPPPGHTPPGGGTPPTSGSGTPPIRNPFKRLVRSKFSDADYAKFDNAFHKMSQDPATRADTPGSGALTRSEQDNFAKARALVQVQPDTMMSKVIPASDWPKYTSGPVSGRYDSIGGFQARAEDTSHLANYGEMRNGLRLDYTWKDSAGNTVVSFPPNGTAYVVEYPAGDPSRYQVPFGGSYDEGVGQTKTDAPVVQAQQDMEQAGRNAGYTPGQIDSDVRGWPNTGTAVTGHGDDGVPEFTTPDRMDIPAGAPAYRVDASGKHLIGYYDPVLKDFVMPPPGGTP